MNISKQLLLIICLIYLASSKISHIKLSKKETKSQIYQRRFFYKQFGNAGSFEKFISQNKFKRNFLKKHFATLKRYYSEYEWIFSRFKPQTSKFSEKNVIQNLINGGNNAWYGNYSIGTPNQNFNGMFDTGSADCLVSFSGGLPQSDFPYPVFDPNASSTYTPTNDNFTITYGSGGTVNGKVGIDTISIGGLRGAGFRFAEISQGTILGLGFQSLSNANTTPAIQLFYQQGEIPEAVFGLYLDKELPEGQISIGGIDNTKFIGNIIYINLLQPSYWIININGYIVNNTLIQGSEYGIVDSGTTLLLTSAANQIATAIGDPEQNCPSPNLQTVFVSIGEVDFPLTPNQYLYYADEDGSETCLFGFSQSNFFADILGDVFITNYYAVFDYTNQRVGFARSIAN